MKIFILFLICLLLIYNAAFLGWHFYYLAQGIRPLIIDEPNIWIARTELLFYLCQVILGLIGIYALTKIRGD